MRARSRAASSSRPTARSSRSPPKASTAASRRGADRDLAVVRLLPNGDPDPAFGTNGVAITRNANGTTDAAFGNGGVATGEVGVRRPQDQRVLQADRQEEEQGQRTTKHAKSKVTLRLAKAGKTIARGSGKATVNLRGTVSKGRYTLHHVR